MVCGLDGGDLADDLLRLIAAAGLGHHQVAANRLSETEWTSAALVLLSAEAASVLAARPFLPRRAGVLIVGAGQPDSAHWADAVAVGAERVLVLDADQSWLSGRLEALAGSAHRPGPLIAVAGGSGGVGTTTLAAGLAVSAAAEHEASIVVSAVPSGGGLDVVLGSEDVEGPRWPDLVEVTGRLSAAALLDGLPRCGGVRFLAGDRSVAGAVPQDALRAVLAAARRSGSPVVLEVPGHVAVGSWLTEQIDLAVLLVTPTLDGVLGARAAAGALGWAAPSAVAVVRAWTGADLDDRLIADSLAVPIVASLRRDRAVLRARRQGSAPGDTGRGPLARCCADLWRRTEAAAAAARERSSKGVLW